jgi:Ser/Thr protein kinase RdoA (MazF antagonist)
VLHPDFIAEQVAARYALQGPVKGFLLYRGINDVYLVAAGDQKYALRVWRRGGREIDMDAVSYEVNFLDYLRQQQFPVSAPLRARDGSLYFKVDSTEGARALALYDWAPGRKFGECLDEGTAYRIGAVFARLHHDGVGTDYLMQDVQNYRWGNLFYGFDDRYADAFERGYESVRPLTAGEKRHADLFLLAKTFRLVSGMAQISVAVGRGTLRFRNLDWLGGYIRSKARPLGLL